MKLSEIIKDLPIKIDQNFIVEGITDNSQEVKENFIFVAIKGLTNHGDNYIAQAIEKGAKLVISENYHDIKPIAFAQVNNAKEILGILLSRFYNTKPENMVAVTGTNGKSSVVHFYRSIFQLLKENSASIGTLGIISNIVEFPQKLHQITTPSLTELHQVLYKLKSLNVDFVAMEASSHGLVQNRLANLEFQAAAITSFAVDHLDYHKTREEYFQAKLKLFTEILQVGKVAIINNDIEAQYLEILKEKSSQNKLNIITYGKEVGSSLRIIEIVKLNGYQKLVLEYQGKIYQTEVNLIGEFQIYNILAAIGLALASGKKFEDICQVIPSLTAAYGRMREVKHPALKGKVYIDYAHTADALEYILKDLRQYTQGNLKILFGCGGGKDPNRRAMMGRVANQLADIIYITDDNPRDEDPALIRSQIIEECPKAIEIADRRQAIKEAVNSLEHDDILVITGKGHELYHIVKGIKSYFSDEEEVITFCEKKFK